MAMRPPCANLEKEGWLIRFERKLKEAQQRKGEIDLIFIGDSIIEAWQDRGKREWKRDYAAYGALNLGFGGDRTEHVLWRIENGALEGLNPSLVVLLIGTNNTGHCFDPPEHTANDIGEIVQQIHAQLPGSSILLHAILPCGQFKDDQHRITNNHINKLIQPLSALAYVHWLDLSPVFLQKNGEISETVMKDFLHPNVFQYKRWANALTPVITNLLSSKSADV